MKTSNTVRASGWFPLMAGVLAISARAQMPVLVSQDFEAYATTTAGNAVTPMADGWMRYRASVATNSVPAAGHGTRVGHITSYASAGLRYWCSPAITGHVGTLTFDTSIYRATETIPTVNLVVFLADTNDKPTGYAASASYTNITLNATNEWAPHEVVFNQYNVTNKYVVVGRDLLDSGSYRLQLDNIVLRGALTSMALTGLGLEGGATGICSDEDISPVLEFTLTGTVDEPTATLYSRYSGETEWVESSMTASGNTYVLGSPLPAEGQSNRQLEMYAVLRYSNALGAQTNVWPAAGADDPVRIDILPFSYNAPMEVQGGLAAVLSLTTNLVWSGGMEREAGVDGATYAFACPSNSISWGDASAPAIPYRAVSAVPGATLPSPAAPLGRDIVFGFDETVSPAAGMYAQYGNYQSFENWDVTSAHGWTLGTGVDIVTNNATAQSGARFVRLPGGATGTFTSPTQTGIREASFWFRRDGTGSNVVTVTVQKLVGAIWSTVETFTSLPTGQYAYRSIPLNDRSATAIRLYADAPTLLDGVAVTDVSDIALVNPGVSPDPVKATQPADASVQVNLLSGAEIIESGVVLSYRYGTSGAFTNVTLSLTNGLYQTPSDDRIAPAPDASKDLQYYITAAFNAWDGGGPFSRSTPTNTVRVVPYSEWDGANGLVVTNDVGNGIAAPLNLISNQLWSGAVLVTSPVPAPTFRFQDSTNGWWGSAQPKMQPAAGTATNGVQFAFTNTVSGSLAFTFNEANREYRIQFADYEPFEAGALQPGWSATNVQLSATVAVRGEAALTTATNAVIVSPTCVGVGDVTFWACMTNPAATSTYTIQKFSGGVWTNVVSGNVSEGFFRYHRAVVGDPLATRVRVLFGGAGVRVDELVVTDVSDIALVNPGVSPDPVEATQPADASVQISLLSGAEVIQDGVVLSYRYGTSGAFTNVTLSLTNGLYQTLSGDRIAPAPDASQDLQYYITADFNAWDGEGPFSRSTPTNTVRVVPYSEWDVTNGLIVTNDFGNGIAAPLNLTSNQLWRGAVLVTSPVPAPAFRFQDSTNGWWGSAQPKMQPAAGTATSGVQFTFTNLVSSSLAFSFNEANREYLIQSADYEPFEVGALQPGWSATNVQFSATVAVLGEAALTTNANAVVVSPTRVGLGVGDVTFWACMTNPAATSTYTVQKFSGGVWTNVVSGNSSEGFFRYHRAVVGDPLATRVRVLFGGAGVRVDELVVTAAGAYVTLSNPTISTNDTPYSPMAAATNVVPVAGYGKRPVLGIAATSQNGAAGIAVRIDYTSDATPAQTNSLTLIGNAAGGVFTNAMPALVVGTNRYWYVVNYTGMDATEIRYPAAGDFRYSTDGGLGVDRQPDPVAWAVALGASYLNNRNIDGWNINGVYLQDGGVQFDAANGQRSMRSPALNGVGTVYFRAKPTNPTLEEDHLIAVELATSSTGPWTTNAVVKVAVGVGYTTCRVVVNDYRNPLYVRLRRISPTADPQNRLAVRDVVITPPPADVVIAEPSIITPGYPSADTPITFRFQVGMRPGSGAYPASDIQPTLISRWKANPTNLTAWVETPMTNTAVSGRYAATLDPLPPGQVEYHYRVDFSGLSYTYGEDLHDVVRSIVATSNPHVTNVLVTTDRLRVTNVWYTGDALQLTPTGSDTLPSPLATNTYYYAIMKDAAHIQLAQSYESAVDGDPIDITDIGVGEFTLTKQKYSEGRSPSYLEWNGTAPTNSVQTSRTAIHTPRPFRVRMFDSNHSVLELRRYDTLENTDMILVGDHTWQAVLYLTNAVNMGLQFAGTNSYTLGATAYGPVQSWGDVDQVTTNPPLSGVADLGSGTNIFVQMTDTNTFVMFRLDAITGAYQVRRAAFQDFNTWQASDVFFEESLGLFAVKEYATGFEGIPLTVRAGIIYGYFDTAPTNALPAPDSPPYEPPFYADAWRLENAWVVRERVPTTNSTATPPPANQAVRINAGAGTLQTTPNLHTEGRDALRLRHRVTFGDENTAHYRNGFTWKDYQVRGQAAVSQASPGFPTLSLIGYYYDRDNFYELRLTQDRVTPGSNSTERVVGQLYRKKDGVYTPVGTPVTTNSVSLTGKTWNVGMTLNTTNGTSVQLSAYLGVVGGVTNRIAAYTDTSAGDALTSGGTVSVNVHDTVTEFSQLEVLTAPGGLPMAPVFTNDAASKWYLGGTPAGGTGTRWTWTAPGTLARPLPAVSFNVGIIRVGEEESLPDVPLWTPVHSGSSTSLVYTAVEVPLTTWDNTFIQVRPVTSDGMLVVDDLIARDWRGVTVTDPAVLPPNDPLKYTIWRAEQAYTSTHGGSRMLELTRSRANPANDQMLVAPRMENGVGTVSFNYAVTGGDVRFGIERNAVDGLVGDGNSWVTVTNVVVAAGVTGEFYVPIRTNMVGRIRILMRSESDDAATLWLDNLFVTDYPRRDNTSWSAYNALITKLQGDKTFEPGLTTHRTAFLNNSAEDDVRDNIVLSEDKPFIQSPEIARGIGEIGFWYRAWDPEAQYPGKIKLMKGPSPDAPPDQWTEVTVVDPTTGAVSPEDALYKAKLNNITNSLYEYLYVQIFDQNNKVLRIYSETNQASRVALDQIIVTEPVRASVNILDVKMIPAIPLADDPVGVEVWLGKPGLDAHNVAVFLDYHVGSNVWGVANWGGNPTLYQGPRVKLTVDPNDADHYTATNAIPAQPVDSVVQYRVVVTYDGTYASPSQYTEFTNPSWYFPVDLNAQYAAQGTSPHYFVFSCPTGAVFVNEFFYCSLHSSSTAYKNREFVELIGPRNASLANWRLDVVDAENGRSATVDYVRTSYTNPPIAYLHGGTNGWGFYTWGDTDPAISNRVDNYFHDGGDPNTLPKTVARLPLSGGFRVVRGMGAYAQRICYGSSQEATVNMPNRGYEYTVYRSNNTAGQANRSLGLAPDLAGSNLVWNTIFVGLDSPSAVNPDETELLGVIDPYPEPADPDPVPAPLALEIKNIQLSSGLVTVTASAYSTNDNPAELLTGWSGVLVTNANPASEEAPGWGEASDAQEFDEQGWYIFTAPEGGTPLFFRVKASYYVAP